MSDRSRKRLRAIVLGILVIAAVVSLAQGVRNAIAPDGSLDTQWDPGRALLARSNPYAMQWEHYRHPDTPPPFMLAQVPWYPPYSLVLFWPFAALSWPAAKTLWALANLGFFAVLVIALRSLYLHDRPFRFSIAAACLFACGTPLRNLIGNGQHGLMALAFFAIALVAVRREREVTGGMSLALAFFKYSVTLPLVPILLPRRPWKAIAIAVLIPLALFLFAAYWIGAPPLELGRDYLRMLGAASGLGFLDIFSLCRAAGIGSSLVPAVISLALFASGAALAMRHGARNELLALSLLAMLAFVLVYHLTYDFVLLVFPLFFLFSRDGLRDRPLAALLAATLALVWFVEKPVYLLRMHAQGSAADTIFAGYYWITAIVYYSTLLFTARALVRRTAIS